MKPPAPSASPKAGLSGWAQALAWRDEPGLVFFESALTGLGRRALVARRPSLILRGSSRDDWRALERVLEENAGREDGFLAGWVAYEGNFEFGLYEEVKCLEPEGAGAWDGQIHEAPVFRWGLDREGYIGMVRRAQEYIAAGDIYQVNLSYPFEAAWRGDPLAYYAALRLVSPAPQASFLRTGTGAICSASPELFLTLHDRRITTRPIKGTRPRAADPAEDQRLAEALRGSEKERAELIMITDLERNDLGQVCEFGSVAVTDLLRMETYRQVFHLVSTVEGTLRADVSHVEALRACFPGGSITGAPKLRARQIIRELEPSPRGVYTGAIGWFGFNGESQFSIAIRTAVAESERLHFHVGAGIVADSVPELEFEETLHKARGLLAAAERMNEL